MKKTNKEIDTMIIQALHDDDRTYFDKIEDASIFELMFETYKGKRKWLSIYVTILIFVFFSFGVYCANQFFNVQDTKSILMWSVGFFISLMFVASLKIWLWMQMNNIIILRELKRLELQIALLHKSEIK